MGGCDEMDKVAAFHPAKAQRIESRSLSLFYPKKYAGCKTTKVSRNVFFSHKNSPKTTKNGCQMRNDMARKNYEHVFIKHHL